MTESPKKLKAINRLEIVTAYLSGGYTAAMFASLFNAGDIYSYLRRETAPIEAEDLELWAGLCTEAVE
jgi:hypothetical protein